MGHLGDNMGRCPETVQPQAPGIPCHRQAPVANQPCAKQGGRLEVGVSCRNGENEPLVRHGILGEPSIALVACELSLIAKVLPAREAVATMVAGGPKPGDANPFSCEEALHSFPCGDYGAHDLVAENERQLGLLQFAIDDVKVGTADSARMDVQEHLARPR